MGITIFYKIEAPTKQNVDKIISIAKRGTKQLTSHGVRIKITNVNKPRERGIIIRTGVTEDINLSFYWATVDKWVAEDFVKTQPFKGDEFLKSSLVHMWFCSLLHEIEDRGLGRVDVHDEGGFYQKGKMSELQEKFKTIMRRLEILKQGGYDLGE